MTASFRIFVCSTFSDLSQERERVLDAIRRLKLQHDSMEFFGARAGQPIETCLQEVRASDVLVVIVGHRYGSIVPELGISYSEAEYSEGVRLKKPCLVYMRDENVPILPIHMERDPEKLKLLEKWKQTLQSRHTVAAFQDGNRLAVQVVADLARTIQDLEEVANTVTRAAVVAPEEALRDPLTGLANRRAFERAARLAAAKAPYVVGLLDLDGFKQINDTLGYAKGDELLMLLALAIKEHLLPSADIVARMGGDEFAAIFLGTSPDAVARTLTQLIATLPRCAAEAGFPAVTASAGVSSDRIERSELKLKLRDADRAMDQAKDEGGARVKLAD